MYIRSLWNAHNAQQTDTCRKVNLLSELCYDKVNSRMQKVNRKENEDCSCRTMKLYIELLFGLKLD